MKLIKIIIVLAVLFVIGGFVLPADYTISRSIVIDSDRNTIHTFVGDLDKWPEWSPWEKADSSIIVYPGDSSSGLGANQTWKGDRGSGSLVFTASSEDDGITYDMVFDDRDKARASISYSGPQDSTTVTWSMQGSMENTMITGPYMAMSMDMIVGRLFSQGLEDLKEEVEKLNY